MRLLLIVGFVVLLFYFFYTYIFPTYYYWKLEQPVKAAEKLVLNKKYNHISSDIIVLKIDNFSQLSTQEINDNLDRQLQIKRNFLNKFWVSSNTLARVETGKIIQRLYSQGNQKNDFYSRYFKIGDTFYVVGTSIPSFIEGTAVILPLIILTLCFILLLLIMVMIISVRKQIIEPIKKLEILTRRIAKRDFSKINLNKENEISLLTDSINEMSQSLQRYEQKLLNKNNKLKNFSRNLAHEFKTPLSVLQLIIDSHDMGIKNDHFIADLNNQIMYINELIERILEFSQQEKEEICFSSLSVNRLLTDEIKKFSHIDPNFFCTVILEEINIQSSSPHLQIVIDNILSNALKYSTDKKLLIKGEIKQENCILFFINKSKNYSTKELNRILEDFEVGEVSRNQSLSGTGLGFSIIKQSLISLEGSFNITQEKDKFILKLLLPLRISV